MERSSQGIFKYCEMKPTWLERICDFLILITLIISSEGKVTVELNGERGGCQ